ncbi:MAG: ketoacyl-ACP synthase III [Verrucomicrobia bacterium]|nr:ketoacyl-ACP synthase III [Verrucomicrobiota bacterium]
MPTCPATLIAGTGHYVPETVVTTADVDRRLALERNGVGRMVESLTGVRERRHAPPGANASDMAVNAACQALEHAGRRPDDVDLLIFAACSRDLTEPATANIVQTKLGARNAHVLDIANACNSFLSALDVADAQIATGRARCVLVCTGELLSSVINWDIKDKAELGTGFAALTLGDGGGAWVLEPARNDGRGLLESVFYSEGQHWELCVVRSGGSISPRHCEPDTYFTSDPAPLNALAVEHLPRVIHEVLAKTGWTLDDVDLIAPHQVSTTITSELCRILGFPPERVSTTVDRYGNCAAASVPIAFGEALDAGRIGPGSKVLLVGGAAGFSAAAITLVV